MAKSLTTRYFQSARLRLTLIYLLISGLIILIFSLAALSAQRYALQRVEVALENRAQEKERQVVARLLGKRLDEFDQAFKERLLLLNMVLFIGAGISSYVMSGITLRPLRRYAEQQEQFAAEASHELRTPLTTILMEIVALEKTEKRLPQKYRASFDSIKDEVSRMQNMVNGLLTLIRTDSDPYYQQREKVDVPRLVEDVCRQMTPVAEVKNISLVAEILDRSAATILANADQIKQLLLILVDNAIKYSGEGAKVTVEVSVKAKNVRVEVQDVGVGIPESELKHIFDRFYRVGVQAQRAKGAGLGLYIAAKICQNYRGRIMVQSKLGSGSTFACVFPRRA